MEVVPEDCHDTLKCPVPRIQWAPTAQVRTCPLELWVCQEEDEESDGSMPPFVCPSGSGKAGATGRFLLVADSTAIHLFVPALRPHQALVQAGGTTASASSSRQW